MPEFHDQGAFRGATENGTGFRRAVGAQGKEGIDQKSKSKKGGRNKSGQKRNYGKGRPE